MQSAINDLNIRVMNCRSGDGLMSYGYSFLQIGGYVGQSHDDVKGSELWDGDYNGKFDAILDCRNGKCIRISQDSLKQIINNNHEEIEKLS